MIEDEEHIWNAKFTYMPDMHVKSNNLLIVFIFFSVG